MMAGAFALPFTWLADLSRVSSTALIAAIWQGTLLAIVAALALRLVPRIPAAARFAIWFVVFSLIAALPFLGFSLHLGAETGTAAPGHSAWFTLNSRWTLAIVTVWAVASLIRAVTLIAAALRVRTLSHRAAPIEFSPAPHDPSTRRVQVCSSHDVDRPTVIGFFSPKILIPAWLLEKLTPAELEQVILHEVSHLNRADDWLNLLQKIALVLFPLNPALAWVERRLCFERELACDERVLHLLATRDRAATDYASCLTTLAGYRLERRGLVRNLALALGALGNSTRQSDLGRRIARILRPVSRMHPLHSRLAVGSAVLSLLFAATELERCPQIVSFASPAPAAQLAANGLGGPSFAQRRVGFDNGGYRAVPARIALPAAPQVSVIGDAAPRFAAQSYAAPAQPRALSVRADHTRAYVGPRMIATRQPQPAEPDGNLVITRWTVWQSADGYRVVRTSEVVSGMPPTRRDRNITDDPEYAIPAPRARQISQPVSPYAAVPVPGGWFVFQL